MPLQATSGAASYDAFGGGVAAVPNYIEDVFSTYLYTGNGNTAPETQTINNGIDLSTNGGLVWIKNRSVATNNVLFDTARGATKVLVSNATSAESTDASTLTSFNNNGFSVYYGQGVNGQGNGLVSWTFRKQPKFFDIQTFTTTTEPSSPVTISHNLGSTPGFVFIKNMSLGNDWYVYHRSTGNDKYLTLNTTEAATTLVGSWAVTSTTVSIKDNFLAANSTFVVYLCAHDAGGFGLTGTDNVISCGTFAANNGEVINLGYEPQWLLYKDSSSTSNWRIADTMRGFTNLSGTNAQTIKQLAPNTSSAESDNSGPVLTSTGFTWNQSGGGNVHIYIAIRRGPMKVPTSGTSVFYPNAYSGTGTDTTITSTGFPPDLFFSKARSFDSLYLNVMVDRLRGASQFLVPTNTIAETEGTNVVLSLNMNGVTLGSSSNANNGTVTYAQWNFRRAPSFFDEVCWSGAGANLVINHNLQAVPELIINKYRNGTSYGWATTAAGLANPNTNYIRLNTSGAEANSGSSPGFIYDRTSTTFTVSSDLAQSGFNWVSYLFASCPGVSKVGSYTGNGSTQTIDCGFGAGGARFVLIKRIDSTGDWYVYDTARGMTVLTDPYLLINTTGAEVATLGSVTTVSTGFALNSAILAAINVSSGSYIFLAIA